MLADEVDYVVGVDTHRDEHVLAVVVAPSGAVLAQRSVRASARGYAQALSGNPKKWRGFRWSRALCERGCAPARCQKTAHGRQP